MAKTLEQKCPCCGGSLSFDLSSQSVKCPYCGSEFSPESLKENEDALRSDIDDKAEWAADAGMSWEEGEEAGFSLYHCDSCGGEIIADDNTSATTCPYCGSPVLLQGRLSGSLKPNVVIPFSVSKEQSAENLNNFFKKKVLLPNAFKKQNVIDEIRGLYCPYWLYNADLDGRVTWIATRVRHYSDSEYSYTETKYYRIIRAGKAGFDHVPVDGSKNMPDDLMESIEPFNYDHAKAFNGSYLAGFYADKYDVPQVETFPRATERVKQATVDAFASTVDHTYNTLKVEERKINLSKSSSEYALYPVYIMNTHWKNQKFTFGVNGDTGRISGNLPISKVKAALIFAGLFILLAGAIAGLGAFFAFYGGAAMEDAVPAFMIFLLIGLVIGIFVPHLLVKKLIKQCKNVAFQKSATVYYRDDSLRLSSRSDIFLYRRVERVRRSSSSSGSSHNHSHRR